MGKKRFFNETGKTGHECLMPVNYYFLEGKKMIYANEERIVKFVESKKMRAKGYACVQFYKKISRF